AADAIAIISVTDVGEFHHWAKSSEVAFDKCAIHLFNFLARLNNLLNDFSNCEFVFRRTTASFYCFHSFYSLRLGKTSLCGDYATPPEAPFSLDQGLPAQAKECSRRRRWILPLCR